MTALRFLAAVSALASLAASGCRVTGSFACETNEQCRRRGVTGACVAGSCAFVDPSCPSGARYDETAADELAGVCVTNDPPTDCVGWRPDSPMPCELPAPLGALNLASVSYTYNTDTGALVGGAELPHASIVVPQADGSQARVVSVTNLTVGPGVALRVTGSLPLVVVARGDITIHGTIDASSTSGGAIGPGANPDACMSSAATTGQDGIATGGSGGGGGGAFQGAGGGGGRGDYPMIRTGGTGGLPVVLGASVRGGCPGAPSGPAGPGAAAPSSATTVAVGGAGGGAVQLTAQGAIVVSAEAVIHAGGAGGGGAPIGSECGGGGGGSGGFIGLEAQMIDIQGVLAANGGGGGGSAPRTAVGGTGANATIDRNRASGAGGQNCGGGGGRGAAGDVLAGDAVANNASCGGGGGGGGAGFIALETPMRVIGAAALITPPLPVTTPPTP